MIVTHLSSIDDLNLNHLDYTWVANCNEPKLLKRGLKLLKEDGGHFPDLEMAIDEKLKKIDKKYAQLSNANAKISPEELQKYKMDINSWNEDIIRADKALINRNQNDIFDSERLNPAVISLENKKEAEQEKIKGNDYMKTKEYNLAIQHYNSSIKLNPLESTTYCNRALAYIRNKQYEKGYQDCDKAIELKSDYSKAYYRRGQCLMGMSKMDEAFIDFMKLLKENPKNGEILDEIKVLKGKWKTHIGAESYQIIEPGIENDIDRLIRPEFYAENEAQDTPSFLNRAVLKQKDNKKEVNFNIPVSTSVPSEEPNDEKSKKSFKKIKIVEEDEEVQVQHEKNFEGFFAKIAASREESEKLAKDGKLKEAHEINQTLLTTCSNFLPEVGKNSQALSKLENVINELNSQINEYNKKDQESEKVKKYYKTKIIAEDRLDSATKIAEKSLNFDDFGKTSSYGFEKAYSSLKKTPEVLYSYLIYVEPENVAKIYSEVEMNYELMIGIIRCVIQLTTNSKEAGVALQFLLNITKTKKFSTVKMFFKKADKEEIKSFLTGLEGKYSEHIKEIKEAQVIFK